MARIPVYEQRTAAPGPGVTPRASAQPVASIGSALQNLGGAIGGVAQDMFSEQEKLRRVQEQADEDRAALEASNALSKGEAYWHEQQSQRSMNWKPGDPDLRESMGKDYEAWISSTAAALPTDRSRRYFQTQAFSMRSRMDRELFNIQERRTTDMLVQSTQDGMDADFETIYRDPSRRPEVIARRLAAVEAQGRIPIDKRIQIGRSFVNQANLAAERSELEQDPAGYFARRFGSMPSSPVPGEGGSVGFDASVGLVLKHEGGYAESDGNTGAPVNFGINQKANPDIDVKNLTREQAVEIYRQRYWNAIGGDTLPPEIQATALDAAVNQGPSNANKWLAASGGDPVLFNALRRAHYERLLEKPENARFRNTWMRRLEVYEQQSAGTLPASEDAVAPEAPESFMALPYIEREKLRREADQRLRQDAAAGAQALRGRLQDASAMARDGVSDPQPLTRDAFAVLGREGPAAFDEYARSQVMAKDVAAMQSASNADLQAVATGALRRAVPGEGYAAEDARDEIRRQAATQVLKQRETDPAGFVARTVPAVGQAARALFDPNLPAEERAAATQNLARQTLAAQAALGISEPQILTAAATNDLARRIAGATRPEDAAALVGMLEAEYGGQYFGQVMNELMRAGKLSPALMIIPNLPNAAARETVSALAAMKMDELKTGIDSTSQRDVREGAVEYAAELARSLPPVSGSGAALLSSYQDMIERIAYERLRTGVDKSGSAASEGAFRMLLGHYQFDGTLRLPAGESPGQIRGALQHRLDRTLLPALTEADVPGDLTGAYRPDEALAQWRDLVGTNAVWYTAQDDRSAQLWARGQNGVLYRVTQGGRQVTYTFDELRAVTPQVLMQERTGADRRGGLRNPAIIERMRAETEAIRRQVEAEDAAEAATQGAR
jgi:hypothetical protein